MRSLRPLLVAVALVGSSGGRPALADAPVAADLSMSVAVRQRTPAVDLRSVPLDDTLEYLRDVAGLNLHVNWPALEAAGIDRLTPISIKLRQVTLAKVLDLALGEASSRSNGVRLSWYVSDNIIHVTTRDLADRDLITRVYDVRDLLVEVPNFKGPRIGLGESGGEGGVFGGEGGGGNEDGDEPDTTMQQRGDRLAAIVVMLVMPEVWVENGGFSSIRYFNGHLIVTAPRSVQVLIGK